MASIQQLANNLKYLRTTSGKTQDDLGIYLNISRQAYSNYETTRRTPDLDTLLRLSNLYHISLDVLLNVDLSAYSSSLTENHVLREGKISYGAKNSGQDRRLFWLTKEEAEFITKLRVLPSEERERFLNLSAAFFRNS